MAAKGFIELVRLASLHRGVANGQEVIDPSQMWSGICFACADEFFVIPIGEVKEIIDVPTIHAKPVFGVQSWVKGISYIRGVITPIIDFRAFLGLSVKNTATKIIVIDQSDIVSGLMVDRLFGVQHFDVREFKSSAVNKQNIGAKWQKFNYGNFAKNQQVWHIILPSLLVHDYQFSHPVLQP